MAKMVEDIEAGKFEEGLTALKNMGEEELKKAYTSREMEPAMSDESWQPEDRTGLVS
jgi:hypothetical protein